MFTMSLCPALTDVVTGEWMTFTAGGDQWLSLSLPSQWTIIAHTRILKYKTTDT